MRKKYDSSKFKNFTYKKFKTLFHFFTCILPDSVGHKLTKEFCFSSNVQNVLIQSKKF